MNNGEFYRHLRRVRRIYGERRKTLIRSIEDQLIDVLDFEDPQAGLQFVVKFKHHFDDVAISRAAQAQRLPVIPLSSFFTHHRPQKGLLIGFCGHEGTTIMNNSLKLKAIFARYT